VLSCKRCLEAPGRHVKESRPEGSPRGEVESPGGRSPPPPEARPDFTRASLAVTRNREKCFRKGSDHTGRQRHRWHLFPLLARYFLLHNFRVNIGSDERWGMGPLHECRWGEAGLRWRRRAIIPREAPASPNDQAKSSDLAGKGIGEPRNEARKRLTGTSDWKHPSGTKQSLPTCAKGLG
jgi:hypothetical protein